MSNSIILTNILDTENSIVKNAINSYMEDKINEFKIIMKHNIEKVITDKIDNFYKKSFDNHDDILFNTDATYIITKIKNYLNNILTQIASTNKSYINEIKLRLKNVDECTNKCFSFGSKNYTGNGYDGITYYYLKRFVIVEINRANNNLPELNIHNHNLSNDLLFTIKTFNIGTINNGKSDSCLRDTFTERMKIIEDNPEYFKTNCSNFETTCKKEYEIINQQKEELQKLTDENIAKIEYYKSLELKIIDIEKQEKQIIEDNKKIQEDKNNLMIVKKRLSVMKTEIEKEKKELEKEKNKHKLENFDMDKYFDELTST